MTTAPLTSSAVTTTSATSASPYSTSSSSTSLATASSQPITNPAAASHHGFQSRYIPLVVILPLSALFLGMAFAVMMMRRRRRKAVREFQARDEAGEKPAGGRQPSDAVLLSQEHRSSTASRTRSGLPHPELASTTPHYLPPLRSDGSLSRNNSGHDRAQPSTSTANSSFFSGLDDISAKEASSPVRDELPPAYYGTHVRNFSRRTDGSGSSEHINVVPAEAAPMGQAFDKDSVQLAGINVAGLDQSRRHQQYAAQPRVGKAHGLAAPGLERRPSTISVTSTLYSSDASIHEAEPRRMSHASSRLGRDRFSTPGEPPEMPSPARPGRQSMDAA
ncbi:hypothetical protein ANO11243_088450 [Dothideomycetidae sp. 11243]|nr:hypothetical protein ANO11243_088450 [fungal sp. No.11243]